MEDGICQQYVQLHVHLPTNIYVVDMAAKQVPMDLAATEAVPMLLVIIKLVLITCQEQVVVLMVVLMR
jgi:hypothetical protein